MKQKIDWIEKRHALRRAADSMLSGVSQPPVTGRPVEYMMHELLVHKVELEMQVEELKRAHMEMEAARDRFAEYYEFAPVGYLSINREGLISEINLTGATLLGVERTSLNNRRLSSFVSPADVERWEDLFSSMIEGADVEKNTFFLELTRTDGTTFNAYCECRSLRPHDAQPGVRLVLFDSGKLDRATPR